MKQTQTDIKPLDDFFGNTITVEDMANIMERQMWNLIFFELNDSNQNISFPDDLCYLKDFVDTLKNCKTVKTNE